MNVQVCLHDRCNWRKCKENPSGSIMAHQHTLSDNYLAESICTLILCLQKHNVSNNIINIMAQRLFYPFIIGKEYYSTYTDSLKLIVKPQLLSFCKQNGWCIYCRSHITCICDIGCRICCPYIKVAIVELRGNFYDKDAIYKGIPMPIECINKGKECKIIPTFSTNCCPFCCEWVKFWISGWRGPKGDASPVLEYILSRPEDKK